MQRSHLHYYYYYSFASQFNFSISLELLKYLLATMPSVRTLKKVTLSPKSKHRRNGGQSLGVQTGRGPPQAGDFQSPFLCRNPLCHTRPFESNKGLKSHLQKNASCMKAYMKDIASRVGQVNLNEDNLGLGLGGKPGKARLGGH